MAWADGAGPITQQRDWGMSIHLELGTSQAGNSRSSSNSTTVRCVSTSFGNFRLSMAGMNRALAFVKPSTVSVYLLDAVVVLETTKTVAYTGGAAGRMDSWCFVV